MRALIGLLSLVAAPAAAQTTPVLPLAPASVINPAMFDRVSELPGMIAGRAEFERYFAPAFRVTTTKEKWQVVIANVTAQTGQVLKLEATQVFNPWQGIALLRCERGIAFFEIAVDPKPPHQVVGLLFLKVQRAAAAQK